MLVIYLCENAFKKFSKIIFNIRYLLNQCKCNSLYVISLFTHIYKKNVKTFTLVNIFFCDFILSYQNLHWEIWFQKIYSQLSRSHCFFFLIFLCPNFYLLLVYVIIHMGQICSERCPSTSIRSRSAAFSRGKQYAVFLYILLRYITYYTSEVF